MYAELGGEDSPDSLGRVGEAQLRLKRKGKQENYMELLVHSVHPHTFLALILDTAGGS